MTQKIDDTIEAWETGALGTDPKFVQAVTKDEQESLQSAIDSAFGLKPISIRMENEILDSLKAIAKHRGVGYQPLIRQVLHRWVDCELKQIALESMDKNEEQEVVVNRTMINHELPKAA